jgi:hypothetical protein
MEPVLRSFSFSRSLSLGPVEYHIRSQRGGGTMPTGITIGVRRSSGWGSGVDLYQAVNIH